jgi:hypothetical protein
LKPEHSRDKHQARVFAQVLGFDPDDAFDLMNQIRSGLDRED